MKMQYNWYFTPPTDSMSVHMANSQDDKKVFDATLILSKQPMTSMNCAKVLALYPLMTLQVVIGIYWQAMKIFIKRIPLHSHPKKITTENQGGAEQAN